MSQPESDQMIKVTATLNMSVWSVFWAIFYLAGSASEQPLGMTLPVAACGALGLVGIAWLAHQTHPKAMHRAPDCYRIHGRGV